MRKLILHIGLPKTATSTMQEHLFYKLHQEGKINYLGRRSEDNSLNFIDSFYELKKQKIVTKELKSKINSLLSSDLVNVYSEEQLSLYVNDNFQTILPLIVELLEDVEIEILLGFRELSSFFYSYYVEMYRWRYSFDSSNDTIMKFFNNYVNNSKSKDYKIFDYKNILHELSDLDCKVNLLFYEDIINNCEDTFECLSGLLGVNVETIKSAFNFNENSRVKSARFKASEKLTLINHVGRFNRFLKATELYDNLIKGSRFELLLLKLYLRIKPFLNNIPAGKEVLHEKLTPDMVEFIKTRQTLDGDFLTTEQFNRLSNYGYFSSKINK